MFDSLDVKSTDRHPRPRKRLPEPQHLLLTRELPGEILRDARFVSAGNHALLALCSVVFERRCGDSKYVPYPRQWPIPHPARHEARVTSSTPKDHLSWGFQVYQPRRRSPLVAAQRRGIRDSEERPLGAVSKAVQIATGSALYGISTADPSAEEEYV